MFRLIINQSRGDTKVYGLSPGSNTFGRTQDLKGKSAALTLYRVRWEQLPVSHGA